jgi:hypothetical protein
MKKIPSDWQLAGLTNEDGDLRTLLGSDSIFFLPPDVSIEESGSSEKVLLSIKYPVPARFMVPMIHRATNDELEGKLSLSSLAKNGWKKKKDSTGVLRDFLKLTEGVPQDVKNFVLNWGPLWRCREHRDCVWGVSASLDLLPKTRCTWFPLEPISVFQEEAKRVRAALDLFPLLWKANPEPVTDESYWLDLGTQYRFLVYGYGKGEEKELKKRVIEYQRYTLLSKINSYLSAPGGPGLGINWAGDAHPKLKIGTGWGFISAVWLEVAEVVTGTRDFYLCDGCGKQYLRQGRKPAEGKLNFCTACGKPAAKREWARRHKRDA